MEATDALAAAVAAALTLGLLTAFDVVTGSEIAWVLNVGVAALIGVFVVYTRARVPA